MQNLRAKGLVDLFCTRRTSSLLASFALVTSKGGVTHPINIEYSYLFTIREVTDYPSPDRYRSTNTFSRLGEKQDCLARYDSRGQTGGGLDL